MLRFGMAPSGARTAWHTRGDSRGKLAARPSSAGTEACSETLRAMVEVAFDTSPLAQTRAGTARYIRGLLAELERTPELRVERHAFALGGRAVVPVRDVGWYLGALPLLARGADVLHCPTFRAPVRPGVPLVVTFHDLAVLRYPEMFNTWTRRYSRVFLPRVARAAARVIAVSEFTARELVDVLGMPDEKIRVIPNAVGPPFTATGDSAEGDYVLAVSTLEPRKNLGRLVEGFRRAGLNGSELRVVGARGWGNVEPPPGGDVRWLGEVSDDELARLYRGARCAAYLSLYEGFGLPVLEAMACGTPVVAADLPPIQEFGAGVVTVDPRDAEAIAAGLGEAIARGDQLGREGRAAAAAYDSGRVARETIAVYSEVAG
jgi:glycosyltransferase involved in cell wall biosynthesis